MKNYSLVFVVFKSFLERLDYSFMYKDFYDQYIVQDNNKYTYFQLKKILSFSDIDVKWH